MSQDQTEDMDTLPAPENTGSQGLSMQNNYQLTTLQTTGTLQGIQQTLIPVSSVDSPVVDFSQDINDQYIYTDHDSTSDPTHSSDSQQNEQVQQMQNNHFLNGQDISGPITKQPAASSEQHLPKTRPDHQDISSAGDQDSRTTSNDMKPGNLNTWDRKHSSDSQRNETPPSSCQFSNDKSSHTAGAEGLDSRTIGSVDRTHSPEEGNCKVGDESQSSAPQDIAKFMIKVDLSGPFTDRWKATLQKAIQSWLSKDLEGTASVHFIKLMDDPSYAEVQVTPSAALEAIKKFKSIHLTFKNEHKKVTTWIFEDNIHSVTGQQNPFILDKNRFSSPQVNSAVPSGDKNSVKEVSATNSGLSVPLYLFWYMHHAYRKELEQIEKQHGVSICADVSVSIKHSKSPSPDSVSKATDDFEKLVQGCVGSFSNAAINHNHMDSDIVKEALHAIQSEETKMMFTKSASDCLFFGPKKYTDMIKREVEGTRMGSQFNDKSSQMNKDNNFSPQSRSSFIMDTKDLPPHLEMDKVHWDLMKLSYKKQLSQLETKYGVSFNEEKQKKNLTIKVQAQSKGVQHINLESHAIRALTQLYQKLASAAVTCDLKNPTDAALVVSAVEKLQQEQHCVVVEDALRRWRLVGLPEHLGLAIAEIEKRLQKRVFDDEMKKSIAYSRDVPHTRGIKWNQTPGYGPGAVGGSVREEGLNLRRQSEADTGFNEELKDSSRHNSKDTHTDEEQCVICMDSIKDKRKLKCGHEFCRVCISESEKSLGPICPVCKDVYGKLEGNQPNGKMKVNKTRTSLSGYPDCGTIEIIYDIPDGVQTEKHSNPGKPFYGAIRHAYLPDNREGKEVLSLLQRAFQQKLIFTVGRSTTTGADNVVTWNDIHHKTNTSGGPERYGYPDPGYLKRVKDEIKAKGIE